MAINPQRVGSNMGARAVKTPAIRLSDALASSTEDYADVIVGDGAPSGAYGRASGVTMLYLRKDASTDATAAYVTVDGGTSWVAVSGRVYSNTAAGSALTNSTSETVLGSATIGASVLKAGSVLRFRAKVLVTANNSTTTLTVRVRLGATTLVGTAVVTSTATDTAANDVCYIEGELISRAAPGASVAVEGCGTYSEPAAPGGALKTWSLSAANFATNGALLLEVTGQWSAADANSCRLEHLSVDVA